MSHVIRGEIWLVNFEATTQGQAGHRTGSVVIISPPEMHDYLHTVIVAPISTEDDSAPFRISVRVDGEDGLVLLDRITTLDKDRLILKLGVVEADILIDTLETLRETFSL